MPKLNWKYIGFLSMLVCLYFVLLYFMPQRFNWFISLYQKDKNPFGTYVFKTLIDKSWLAPVKTTNKTLYELANLDSMPENNILVLCEVFSTSKAELQSMLDMVSEGKTLLVAAHQMDTVFTDTLGARINQLSFSFYLDQLWDEDSVGLHFVENARDSQAVYWLPGQLAVQYFESYDPHRAQVLAKNSDGKPVLLRFPFGNGAVILSSTPLMFSNFSMMSDENHTYVSGMMSYLPKGELLWTEYYQLGRMEARTPLRYILSEPSLKWAFFTLFFSVLLLMVFEARRKQRVIPVITPLKNETLSFVKTISRLYYQKNDHKDLAAKKIMHIAEHLKQHLQIDINDDLSEVIARVAAKTQSDEAEVKKLFDQINHISSARHISSENLRSFIDRAEQIFNKS